jgi:hypothetical protein
MILSSKKKMGLKVLGWDYDKFISIKCECVFKTRVLKKNDLFLKDYKGQL